MSVDLVIHLYLSYFRLEVRLPRTWLSLVEEIAWNYDEEAVDSMMGRSFEAAQTAAMNSSGTLHQQLEAIRFEGFEEQPENTAEAPDTTIPLDLLSPVSSRDNSPRRFRPKSQSPARWKILRSISDAIQNVMDRRASGVYGTSLY